MTEFQERVVTERKELYDKCENLNGYVGRASYGSTKQVTSR